MPILLGNDDGVKTSANIYLGVDDTPKEVKEVYIGDSAAAPQSTHKVVSELSLLNQIHSIYIQSRKMTVYGTVTPPMQWTGSADENNEVVYIYQNYAILGINCNNFTKLRIRMNARFSSDYGSTARYNAAAVVMSSALRTSFLDTVRSNSYLISTINKNSYTAKWCKYVVNGATDFSVSSTITLPNDIIAYGLDIYIGILQSTGPTTYVTLNIPEITLFN